MFTSDVVSITVFNRGGASGVFENLKNGPKIVVKNNVPVCVMISPQAYDDMAAQIKEVRLLLKAKHGRDGLTTVKRMMDDFGITEEDLDSAEDDSIE